MKITCLPDKDICLSYVVVYQEQRQKCRKYCHIIPVLLNMVGWQLGRIVQVSLNVFLTMLSVNMTQSLHWKPDQLKTIQTSASSS